MNSILVNIWRSVAPTLLVVAFAVPGVAQTANQPKVAPGPGEPDWRAILEEHYGLSMFGDLLNPVKTTAEATPGLFKKAGKGPVGYMPIIALGLDRPTRGGWYTTDVDPPIRNGLWIYSVKNTADDLKTGKNLPPRLLIGSRATFDPGDKLFGLWISNDQFNDGGAYTQPAMVARFNTRLAKQPYKAMIYPNRDKKTGKLIPNSYLIGWEYSTNDDFQDVVCQVDNVELIVEQKTSAKK